MLTEDRVRRLLQHAADTIDPGPPGTELDLHHRRRWLAPAAAAAVVVLLASLGGVWLHRPGPTPGTPGPPVADNRFRLGPDQVPNVFGYTGVDAKAMLTSKGYAVTTVTRRDCIGAGRALRTRPAVGTIVSPDTRLTLVVGAGPAQCPDAATQRAWTFLDWVNGRGPAPRLARQVTVYTDGDPPRRHVVDTSRSDLPSAAWPGFGSVRSAESKLLRFLGSPGTDHPTFFTPAALSARSSAGFSCFGQPAQLAGRVGLVIDVEPPSDFVRASFCWTAVLYYDRAGAIDAIEVGTPPIGNPPVPDVIANSAAYATERLEQAGFEVNRVDRPDCAQPGMVTDQSVSGGRALIAVASRSASCAPRLPGGQR